ncbi:hypothetical protein [Streptomyces salyersiae]|uniref:Uncharacterized protein n=1 Tax=Streptomyces salyersiae TaxID=3075530 RepID=A0ABU2RVP6_9ACTN|nr:hypothetical protein [Streptomyces sp. DSM 41770]MDT0432897.1 hypothetical protein [Streptomyces sp. DSM 41770]
MIRIVRTRTLREADAQAAELQDRAAAQLTRADELETALAESDQAAIYTGESLLQAQETIKRLQEDLATARDDLARARGELGPLRAQHLLDIEDRVVLRTLLRTARRQRDRADRVHVLFRNGQLHSLHATSDAAEIAAEAEGAPRSGWTAHAPGAALPSAAEVTWRIQQLPLGGVR